MRHNGHSSTASSWCCPARSTTHRSLSMEILAWKRFVACSLGCPASAQFLFSPILGRNRWSRDRFRAERLLRPTPRRRIPFSGRQSRNPCERWQRSDAPRGPHSGRLFYLDRLSTLKQNLGASHEPWSGGCDAETLPIKDPTCPGLPESMESI